MWRPVCSMTEHLNSVLNEDERNRFLNDTDVASRILECIVMHRPVPTKRQCFAFACVRPNCALAVVPNCSRPTLHFCEYRNL